MTQADVEKADAVTGMVTLKHGAIENIVDMPPMTVPFEAKDARKVDGVKCASRSSTARSS